MTLSYPIPVHLTGGEQTGWALDADGETTRQTLEALPDLVRLTSLEEAQVVHSVWEEAVLRMDPARLAGKRVVSHVCNDVMRTFELPVMARAGARLGLWIPISRMAEQQLQALRYATFYMPYTVDPAVFTPRLADGLTRSGLRERWGIPLDAYVISNFMRDSRGDDLNQPKPQKGCELLVNLLRLVQGAGRPVHVLLAGPRRHWMRAQLRAQAIPFTFVGQELAGDDNHCNILDPATINLLYHASDVHVVCSRWEGGPRAVLECAATRTKIISTPVGMAPDVLEPESIFRDLEQGLALLERDLREDVLARTLDPQQQRIQAHHTPAANIPLMRRLYEQISQVPVYQPPVQAAQPVRRSPSWWSRVRNVVSARGRPGAGLCIGLWHEYHKPPYGGGNQFMLALRGALERLGTRVVVNRMSRSVDVHLCNSAWFDVDSFTRARGRGALRMIHRVDGPVALYRGTDWSEDERIFKLNQEWASATVFQSGWCMRKMVEHGLDFRRPVILRNAVDARFFHAPRSRPPAAGRPLRIISSAWSDNPRKGGPLYRWLDEHLDTRRFSYTFVGRVRESFTHIRHVGALPSRALGALLREHDLYITASQNEPCSNALLEAMACGLPALYLDQGGHGELVGLGGLPFQGEADVLAQLDRLAARVEDYRAMIWQPTIEEVAARYIELARMIVDDAPGA